MSQANPLSAVSSSFNIQSEVKKPRINWSNPQVLAIVSEEVKRTPDNLASAFERIAQRVGTNATNANNAWYQNLRKTIGTQFNVSSNKKVMNNSKNTPRVAPIVQPIHSVSSSAVYDGMRIVTIKQYFAV